jgi:TatD DNase family protein
MPSIWFRERLDTVRMFDTHVNLHAEAFSEDLDEVLARARTAGVTRFLAICDRYDNYDRVKSIANEHPDIWNTVGVHPHHAKDFTDLTSDLLVAAANDEKTVAIGETGLDFHYGYSNEADQVANFRRHISAARDTGLPLVVHTREADELTADILEDEYARGAFGILLHCYTGGQDLADRGLALGAYVSVSGILSFKSARDVRSVIETVPLDRIILETDCPYLAPVPYRGRRNEPSYLPYVADALASLTGRERAEITSICEANALNLFKKLTAS